MNNNSIAGRLEAVGALPGVTRCALVDARSGLVWHHCGTEARDGYEPLWEAAVEYWRLHARLESHFRALGDLHAAVAHHTSGMLVILPCTREPELLVVCHGAHKTVDWHEWQRRVRLLGTFIQRAL